MNKDDARRRLRELIEGWVLLEISLRNAKEMLESEDCPEPWDRWDKIAELADATGADLAAGDAFYSLCGVVEGLEKLIQELPE